MIDYEGGNCGWRVMMRLRKLSTEFSFAATGSMPSHFAFPLPLPRGQTTERP